MRVKKMSESKKEGKKEMMDKRKRQGKRDSERIGSI